MAGSGNQEVRRLTGEALNIGLSTVVGITAPSGQYGIAISAIGGSLLIGGASLTASLALAPSNPFVMDSMRGQFFALSAGATSVCSITRYFTDNL